MRRTLLAFSFFLLLTACAEPDHEADILATLNAETAAAFSRDYAAWQTYWVQAPYVTKIYLNFADGTQSETLGWEAVDRFVADYFADHPDPDPLPAPLTEIDVRLYGDYGAWVTYEQQDPARGRKRETRLMERTGGRWRIAGMQTIIYGGPSPER